MVSARVSIFNLRRPAADHKNKAPVVLRKDSVGR